MSELLQQTSVLAVLDLDASRDFYIDKLGMEEELSVEGWSFLRRGEFRLRLGHCPDDEPTDKGTNVSFFGQVMVKDAESLYSEFVDNGVEISIPLEDKDWGLREFSIVTIDGHRILFAEEIS
ncbi:MAG: VOC family protein [bacterium]|nr:VOC family protein [bacterium]